MPFSQDRCFANKTLHSNYVKHFIQENHRFHAEFVTLHNENKGFKLTLLGSLKINKLKE